MSQTSRAKGWGCLVMVAAVAIWTIGVGPAMAAPEETPPEGGDVGVAQPRPAEAQPGGETPSEVKPPPARSTAPAPVKAEAGSSAGGVAPKPWGLFFEVGLGGALSVYSSQSSYSVGPGTAFLVGYKLRRLILGLGLEYVHSGSYDEGGGFHAHNVIHSVLFAPTLQYHLIVSNPLVFYGTVALHVGFSVYDDTGTTDDDDTSIALAGFSGGLGFRYFFHPRFAVGVEGGVRGIWVISNYDPPGPGSQKTTTAVVGLYGRVGFVVVW